MSGLDRIREAARRDKDLQFNNLMHHLTLELLREAYWALKKDAAPGVDQVTWEAYGEELDGNLTYLHRRVQSGKYRARPTKRVWIAKDDGKQRPLGVTALEDKIVQQALVQRPINSFFEKNIHFPVNILPA